MSKFHDALKAATDALTATERDGVVTDDAVRAAQLALKRALKVLGTSDLYHQAYPTLSVKRAEASKAPGERMALARNAEALIGVAFGRLNAAKRRW